MATLDVAVASGPSPDHLIDQYLCGVGFGVNPAELRRVCRREVMRLCAKSDAELWLIGLRRADIPAYVLRHWLPSHAPACRPPALRAAR